MCNCDHSHFDNHSHRPEPGCPDCGLKIGDGRDARQLHEDWHLRLLLALNMAGLPELPDAQGLPPRTVNGGTRHCSCGHPVEIHHDEGRAMCIIRNCHCMGYQAAAA